MQSKSTLIKYLLVCIVCLAIIFSSDLFIRILNSMDLSIKRKTVLSDDSKTNTATNSNVTEIERIETGTEDFSDPRKWNIILTVNRAYIDIFNNWLWYFKRLHIKVNVTVIAEDDLAYEILRKETDSLYLNTVRSWVVNISKPLKFASKSYQRLVSARPAYILRYLQAGYNVLYSDVDTVWLQNPFSYFKEIYDVWGQSESQKIQVCAGFIAVRSNAKTIRLLHLWQNELRRKSQQNQPAFNSLIKQQNITVYYLDEGLFIGGREAFNMTFEQLSNVVMVHATFCFGLESKHKCLKKWNLWYGMKIKAVEVMKVP